MKELFEILVNALPEAIGALMAAGVLALVSYLFVKKFKKPLPQPELPIPIINEPPKPEIPSNLPPRSAFVGREKEKQLVKDALNSRWPLICIDGIGGIGKTSLALEVVSECLDASKKKLEGNESIESDIPLFDGFIWTSAKDRELKLNDVLDAVARTLDWPGIAQQPVEEKRESVRKLLQTKRYLVVLDNFETITDESIRDFLLKLPEPSKALITSREQKLPQAWMVSIKGLEQNEALILIRNEGLRLGLKSIENAEDQVLSHLYQATGGAPLAIKWAVGQIKQKGQSLDMLLAALHEAKGDIFEEVFARSWSLLTEDAKKVLIVMPIFASSASKDAIEAGSDVHHFALDEALGQLVQMWLVEVTDELEAAKRRYGVHPLTRAFALAKLKMDTENENCITTRVTKYFLQFLEKFGGRNFDMFDFLEIEKENIYNLINLNFQLKNWKNVLFILEKLAFFLGFRGYWQEFLQFGQLGIKAANKLNNRKFLARIYSGVFAWTNVKQGNYQEAKQYINRAIEISTKLNDIQELAYALGMLCKIAREEGEIDEARLLTDKALSLTNQIKDEILFYLLQCEMGHQALLMGSYEEAELKFKTSIAEFKKLGAEDSTITKLGHLGKVLLLQSKYDEALLVYNEFLSLSQKYQRKDSIASAKLGLSKVNEKQGNILEACNLAKEAYALFQKLGMKKYIKEAEEMIERLAKN